jgi:hypothetical protein
LFILLSFFPLKTKNEDVDEENEISDVVNGDRLSRSSRSPASSKSDRKMSSG